MEVDRGAGESSVLPLPETPPSQQGNTESNHPTITPRGPETPDQDCSKGEQGGICLTSAARVRKHRETLRGHHCQRLEVWLSVDVIEGIREVAERGNRQVRDVVQDALTAYLAERRWLIAESQRLTDEHGLLVPHVHSPAHRQLIEAYNRRIEVYRERLTRFNGFTNPDGVSTR